MALFSNRQEEEVLLENLAMLLEAGVGVTSALESISPQLRNTKIKKVISRIQFDLDSGFPLWKSFEKTGLYSQRVISLMRIGEKSGKLVENLELISQQSQKERSFQSQVQAALFYPLIVFSLTIIVGLGVSWFVLPRLAGGFSSSAVALPLVSKDPPAPGCFSAYPSAKKIFPAPVQSLIFAAEQSGQLPGSLVRTGRLFEERSSNTARGGTTGPGPAL